jgi:hypothetical protein
MKSGSLNVLEPSGSVPACRGTGSPISLNTQNTVSFVFRPVLPKQRKEHFFCLKVPRLRPFVLLIGVGIWMWSVGGMILTGGTEILGEKHVLMPVCPPWIAYAVDWDTWRRDLLGIQAPTAVWNTTAIGESNLGRWWLFAVGRGQSLENTWPESD